jgi:hypothetical protein
MRNPKFESLIIPDYPQIRLKPVVAPICIDDQNQFKQSAPIYTTMGEYEVLETVLKFVKFTPDDIERVTKFASVIGKYAAAANWMYGAFQTTLSVLDFLGIVKREEPEELRLLRSMSEKIEVMYKHLKNQSLRSPLLKASEWRVKLSNVTTCIQNAAISRSQENINDLRIAVRELQEIILLMLALETGVITFNRNNQGYFPEQDTEHWIRIAFPWILMRTSGPLTESFGAADDLGYEIWDPGFYLDVLFDALALRVAAATIIEPLNRSTCYDRSDFIAISDGLGTFIKQWDSSFLLSNLERMFPRDAFTGKVRIPDYVGEPFDSFPKNFWGLRLPCIPLGAADPVTGVSSIDFKYRKNFDAVYGPYKSYYVLNNYDIIRSQIVKDRELALRSVVAASGIEQLKQVKLHFDSIASGMPLGISEVVNTTEPKVDPLLFHRRATPEQITLGNLDKYAETPGKSYDAIRYHGAVTKRFRITLGRRMDVSGIQLGYRMQLSAGGIGLDSQINMNMVQYSNQESTLDEDSPPFPTSPIVNKQLNFRNAQVYDAVQSQVFSIADENAFEADGEIGEKHRLLLNERQGSVHLIANVRFSPKTNSSGPAFVFFADVELSTPDEWPNTNCFILTCRIFEKRWVSDPVFPQKQPRLEEVQVDTLNIHFCPSFLTVSSQFFTDYQTAFWNRERAILDSLSSMKKDKNMIIEEFRNPQPIEYHRRFAIRDKEIDRLVASLGKESHNAIGRSLGFFGKPIIIESKNQMASENP